ncbi:MAG: sigma-70 family RNA polymerase sigma factor [Flammeovirgaceae bacterium]|nr:MAG: sigma-70 family RNA polymerase sigma factor [Flammeovirgaceae bacterium]
MTTEQEFAIIDRVLAGHQHAYAELVNQYKNYGFTLALKILNNRAEAEEATQDAFVKAYHHLRNFNRNSKFSTWLYRIVFNTAVSYKRKQKGTFQSIEKTEVRLYPESENQLEKDDKKKFITAAMTILSEADRLALTLFYLKEQSLEEIAEITGMQPNTAKVRIHRARQRLADELTRLLNKEALTL